jgi:hypothetical protein
MRPYLVVIVHVRQQHVTEVALTEHNNVVKAFPSDRTDQPLIEQGAVVVATDYPGLGTAGPHPYLVGDSEARAVNLLSSTVNRSRRESKPKPSISP